MQTLPVSFIRLNVKFKLIIYLKALFLLLFVSLCLGGKFNLSFSQNNYKAIGRYNFKTYSVEEGLAQSKVYSICEDRRGNIWIGTIGGGISRFDGANFVHYSRENGLNSNQVYKIIEDSKGNLWFGTRGGGVTRYDGKEFRHFTEKDGLGKNMVRAILEDSKGNIWFGTDRGGVSIYNPNSENGKLLTTYNQDDGLASDRIYSILEDSKGNLWFATYNGISLLKYENKVQPSGKFINFGKNNGITNLKIRTIIEDRSGNIWIGTFGGGVFKCNMNDEKSKPLFVDYSDKIGLINKEVMTIMEDDKGNIWFGTFGGAFIKYNNSNKIIHFTKKNGLSSNSVTTIMQDSNGNIWFGTFGGGVSKLSNLTFTYFTTEEGLCGNHVKSIMEDDYGNLWFGTFSGGISMFDGINFHNYSKENGFCYDRVFSIIKDRVGNLWFGTDGGGVCVYNPKKQFVGTLFEGEVSRSRLQTTSLQIPVFSNIPSLEAVCSNQIWSMLEDNRGNLWFGTYGNGVCRYACPDKGGNSTVTTYTTKDGLVNNSVFSIIQDHAGNIWFATYDGISKIEIGTDNKKFAPEFINYTMNDGLSSNQIRSIVEDSAGNIWIGTLGGGVNKLIISDNSKRSVTFRHYLKKDGLTSNNIFLMIFDNSGNLWTGTDRGVDKIVFNNDYSVDNVKNFGQLEGFKGIECYDNAVFKDSKGYLWFGTIYGVYKYNPDEDVFNFTKPETYITGIRLFFEEVDWKMSTDANPAKGGTNNTDTLHQVPKTKQLEGVNYDGVSKLYSLPINLQLPYYQNHLTFNFIGISLKIPEKVRYQFRLEGLDENWSPVTAKREAVYPNLSPGKYIFKIIASNDDGVWNKKPAIFEFRVLPPFWQTWWFYTFCGITILSAIYAFIIIREKNLKRAKKLLERKVKLRTAEIEKKKEEIIIQMDEIENQRGQLAIKNKNIAASINYAQRIQDAILPSEAYIKKLFPDSFVFYKIRDVVSGDFPWVVKQGDDIFFTVVDCTGHGVPGAMLSMIGYFLLNEIVIAKNISEPALILDQMSRRVNQTLKQSENPESKDGMDVAFCKINLKKMNVQFAGAHRPLYHLRDGKLNEIKGERFTIGGTQYEKKGIDVKFLTHNIDLKEGDSIYFFTDGLADQFGGPEQYKFMSTRIKNIIIDNYGKSMEQLNKIFEDTFYEWKGENKQIDDILLVGIRF